MQTRRNNKDTQGLKMKLLEFESAAFDTSVRPIKFQKRENDNFDKFFSKTGNRKLSWTKSYNLSWFHVLLLIYFIKILIDRQSFQNP